MARPNQGLRGQQAQGPNHLSEFRKDALEVMAEVFGGKLGKTLAEVLPASIKDELIAQLGGPDGAISDQQIDVFSYLPKFFFRGTMSEESAQSFVRHFGQALRDYGANPHPDKARRRTDLKRIFTDGLNKSGERSADAAAKKMNFFEAVAALPAADRLLVLELVLKLKDLDVVNLPDRDNPGQKKQLRSAEFEKLGNEHEVSPGALRLAIDMLKMRKAPPALEELLRVLTNAPLLNPPKTPEKPSAMKQFFDDVATEARDMLKPTQPGDPLGEPFATMQAKARKWR